MSASKEDAAAFTAKITREDGSVEEIRAVDDSALPKGVAFVGTAKAKKLAERNEIRKNWKLYPPGSSWKRRDGTIAKAGPRYGGP